MDNPLTSTRHRAAFAERLRLGRKVRGFKTARSAAEILDIAPNTYTTWERGERAPDVWELWKIKERLGLSLDWLVHGDTSSLRADIVSELVKKRR